MSVFYFDTSTVVKYYMSEPGSTWIINLIDAHDAETGRATHAIIIASIGIAEGSAAFSLLYRRGILNQQQRQEAYMRFLADIESRFVLVDMHLEDFYTAAELAQTHPLKAYDAVQLAVALRYAATLASSQILLTFVSGDRALLTAARAEGLVTDNPFDHVSPADTPNPASRS